MAIAGNLNTDAGGRYFAGPVDGSGNGKAQRGANVSGELADAVVMPGGTKWVITHNPSANTQATKTQAAAGAAISNVITSIVASISANGVPASISPATVVVRDGATGAGAILWQANLSIVATTGVIDRLALGGLWIVGSANTAMTVEFLAAGGSNTQLAVSATGTTVA